MTYSLLHPFRYSIRIQREKGQRSCELFVSYSKIFEKRKGTSPKKFNVLAYSTLQLNTPTGDGRISMKNTMIFSKQISAELFL